MTPSQEAGLSPADIHRLQAQAWEETWRHVADHSPFYREHFRRAGLSLLSPPPLDRLEAIPPIDKAVLSEHGEAFLCVPRRQVVDIVTTSGSTGQPVAWMLTEPDLQRLACNEELSFGCAGFTAADTVVLAVALDRCFMAGLAYFMGLRKLGCSVLRAGPAQPLLHLDLLRRLEVSAIVGVPSFLALLADKAAEAGLDLPALGVRKAVCIGEPVRHEDFLRNRSGARLEERWNARVFSSYGVTELASSLCECEAGRGGHLHPGLLFLEALDEKGGPVPDGQVGEITATTFGVEGMPLVRYRTGDCAAIHRQTCPCGRSTARVGPVIGRMNHKLKLRGTTLFPATFAAVLDAVPGVASYAIIARRDGGRADQVEVRVACSQDPGVVLTALRDRFQAAARVLPQLTEASSADIEALQMPAGARKRRFFVDLRE